MGTFNPVAWVEALRSAGGHVFLSDDADWHFIVWSPRPDRDPAAQVNVPFIEELLANIRGPVNMPRRGSIECYLMEHPSVCEGPECQRPAHS